MSAKYDIWIWLWRFQATDAEEREMYDRRDVKMELCQELLMLLSQTRRRS